ncbi:MAG TPA: patatin-like phospholipase family protein [Acidimicrobiales bacterium]|nr:patatin-like phospholipase family protein [Acidimicrobiales bacterium]
MTRALVLSGGGPVGIAWQTGLAAGLAAKGVDLREADFILGTSAGSAVGAQLALGREMATVLERYRQTPAAAASSSSSAGLSAGRTSATAASPARMQELMRIMAESAASDGTPEEARALIGRFALASETGPEEAFVAGFSHLADEPFPQGYACTAVDAETGAFQVWDAEAGVPLDRAVASSCAVPGVFPPITIGGRRYIDGGMRSGTNADLAAGHATVLLVTLMGGARSSATAPTDARLQRYLERMSRERQVLLDAGASIETIAPDEASAAVIGANLMDGRLSPAAAEAGFRQGEAAAASVHDAWS